MKQLKNIKNKIEWEEYYNPDFNWDRISFYENELSEDFIREFKDKVNWEILSFYQTLSEDFIRKLKNKVNWRGISKHQELSEKFIREFKKELNIL